MTHIRTIPELVDFLGGDTALAASLDISQSAVAHWKTRQLISPGWHLRLMAKVAEKGATVEPEVFGLDEAAAGVAFPVQLSAVIKKHISRDTRTASPARRANACPTSAR